MKKIILLVFTTFMMVGCKESTQPIILHEMNTYIIDSCEYVGKRVYSREGILAHKGNCCFCTERRKQELETLVEQLRK